MRHDPYYGNPRYRAELEARAGHPEQPDLCPKPSAPTLESQLPPPPNGYEEPTTWKRVAESPEGTVLMATHEGWESVAHDLTIEKREVRYASGETRIETHVEGPLGKIYWRGNPLEGVKLSSLRVPGRGDKGTEGAA